MLVYNDFRCSACDTINEDKLVDNEVTVVDCQYCGSPATKVRSVPNFRLPGNDAAGFPSAHAKWAKKRDQKMAQEKKASYYEP